MPGVAESFDHQLLDILISENPREDVSPGASFVLISGPPTSAHRRSLADQIGSISDGLQDMLASEMRPGVENLLNGPVGGKLAQDLLDGDACPGKGGLAAPPRRVRDDAWRQYGIGGVCWSRHRLLALLSARHPELDWRLTWSV